MKTRKDDFAISKKLPIFSKTLLQNLTSEHNITLTETTDPINLTNGVVTSGQIKLYDEDEVTKGLYIMKSRKEYERNLFRDEISIYLNIENKGLVVITGCGHSGIMNTIKHGQELTGIDKVYAVIGGFHEEWNPEEKVQKKVDFLTSLEPEVVCGMHCTGFMFNKLMSGHPAHTLGVVGTEFHL